MIPELDISFFLALYQEMLTFRVAKDASDAGEARHLAHALDVLGLIE